MDRRPQRVEIVFFMKPAESRDTAALLSRFKTQPLTQEIVDRGGELYREWHPSHGIDVADALLAASVAATEPRRLPAKTQGHGPSDLNQNPGWVVVARGAGR